MKKTLLFGSAIALAAVFTFGGITAKTSNNEVTLNELKAQASAAFEKICESSANECETAGGVYSNQRNL